MSKQIGNRRSNSVLAYRDKKGTIYCRIGIGNRGSIVCTDDICRIFRHCPHFCCSYGSQARPELKGFNYDNKVHTIALSTNICRLCLEKCNNIPKSCPNHRIQLIETINQFNDKIENCVEVP